MSVARHANVTSVIQCVTSTHPPSFLQSEHVPIIVSFPHSDGFPGSSQAVYSQADGWWKCSRYLLHAANAVSPEKGGTKWRSSSAHSGTFLPRLSGSHTFLVAWGELGLAWTGRYIPAANIRPLIIVIEEARQLSGQSWMAGWMPFRSHSLLSPALLV